MQPANFDEVLDQIIAKHPRYARDAYLFLREALDFTQKLVAKTDREPVRHVSGQELLEGVRQFALQQYGPMTMLLLNEWGVHRCEDFGELVFNMVESGLLAKTKKDSREDFKGGYDFAEAFCQPFQSSRRTAPAPTPTVKPTKV